MTRDSDEMIRILETAAFATGANPDKPGIVVERMLSKYGDRIRALTSDDFKNVRVDWMRRER